MIVSESVICIIFLLEAQSLCTPLILSNVRDHLRGMVHLRYMPS
jgi:hypothetical protein